jgi:hypothetical protein
MFPTQCLSVGNLPELFLFIAVTKYLTPPPHQKKLNKEEGVVVLAHGFSPSWQGIDHFMVSKKQSERDYLC